MKVLIIKLASLGDVLATSPLFSLLTEKGYEVDHMVDKDCALVTANNPFVKNQIIVDTSNTFAFLKVISKLFLLKKYDVIFCFHRSDILGLIARMLGKKVYGFENRTSFLYTDSIKYEYKNINRTIQEYNLVLKYDHSIAKPKQLEYYPKESELKKFNLPDKYIVCNPGGGVNKHSEMKSRRWVSEYFNEVIENLPYKVILVGAGDSDELIAKSITSKNAINLINKTTFDETALILKKSLFYFGNDSAILFLAASQGIPTLGIFGPTQPEAATPIGDKQYFIKSKVSCSPCYNPYEGLNSIAYRCDSVECMQDIKPEEVLKKILEILGKENESK